MSSLSIFLWGMIFECILDLFISLDSLHVDAGVGISSITYHTMHLLCVLEHSLA